jgi:hypothetical protein
MKKLFFYFFCLLPVISFHSLHAQYRSSENEEEHLQINGVFPHLTVVGPHSSRSESGIGALLPWADRLWMIGYVAHIQGSRIGLYEIDENLNMKKHSESVTGTYANRYSHQLLDKAIIGPHLIDTAGNVSTYTELAKHRLTATMAHPTDPENKVLFLTMEGLLYEASIREDMTVKLLFDLVEALDIPRTTNAHFKGGFTGNDRVIVANNSYDEREYLGALEAGRLAEWDGKSENWKILEKNPFVEVMGKMSGNFKDGKSVFGNPIFATGWDNKSVILKCFNDRTSEWKTYRLPKGSHSFDHAWNTEWMRIREAQTERFIMDIHGLFYELPMMTYDGKVWGIKPISYHLRIVPDFCFWRGLFVMAGDQTDHGVGQPQSGLLFQNIDDLWNYGKPRGWGGVWREEDVKEDQVSDPFLMLGFDKKMLHLSHKGNGEKRFRIEIDYLGNETWEMLKTIIIDDSGYGYFIFPDGFSAQWVRVRSLDQAEEVSAYFYYN